jgi:hypothetical protein
MAPSIQKIREKLNQILSQHGIIDPKEQQEIIIEIINAFTFGR